MPLQGLPVMQTIDTLRLDYLDMAAGDMARLLQIFSVTECLCVWRAKLAPSALHEAMRLPRVRYMHVDAFDGYADYIIAACTAAQLSSDRSVPVELNIVVDADELSDDEDADDALERYEAMVASWKQVSTWFEGEREREIHMV